VYAEGVGIVAIWFGAQEEATACATVQLLAGHSKVRKHASGNCCAAMCARRPVRNRVKGCPLGHLWRSPFLVRWVSRP
jgi:hypothetical protein